MVVEILNLKTGKKLKFNAICIEIFDTYTLYIDAKPLLYLTLDTRYFIHVFTYPDDDKALKPLTKEKFDAFMAKCKPQDKYALKLNKKRMKNENVNRS